MAAPKPSIVFPQYFTPSAYLDFGAPRSINVGDKASILSDVNEYSTEVQTGGFCYEKRENYGLLCENRYILWRSYGATLELVELSYHYTFADNVVALQLPSAILPSVAIHEVNEQYVLITFATEESVYCITLAHPVDMHVRSSRKDNVYSVLSTLTQSTVSKATVSHQHYGVRKRCVSSVGRRVAFALPSETSTILIMQMDIDSQGGPCSQFEIQLNSLVQRLWSGIRGKEEGSTITSDLLLHELRSGLLLVVQISGDMKLRIWLCKGGQADLKLQVPLASLIDPCYGNITGGRVARGECTDGFVTLAIYMEAESSNLIHYYRFSLDGDRMAPNRLGMNCVDKDFQLSDLLLEEEHVWLLGRYPTREVVLHGTWQTQALGESEVTFKPSPEVCVSKEETVQDAYLDAMLVPRRFSKDVLFEVLKCCKPTRVYEYDPGSLNWFRKSFINAAAEEMKAMTLGKDLHVEEYLLFERQIWEMFYSSCVRAQKKRDQNGRLFPLRDSPAVGIMKMDSVAFVREASHHLHGYHEGDTIRECLKMILDCVSDELFYSFLSDLRSAEDLSFLKDYISRVHRDHGSLRSDILSRVDHVEDIVHILQELNTALDCSGDIQEMCGVLFTDLFKQPIRSTFAAEIAASYAHIQSERSLRLLLAYQVLYDAFRHLRPNPIDLEFQSGYVRFAQSEGQLRREINKLISAWSIVQWMSITRPVTPTPHEIEHHLPVLKLFGVFNAASIPEYMKKLPSSPSLLELSYNSLAEDSNVCSLASHIWAETDSSRMMLCLFMNCQLSHMVKLHSMLKALGVTRQPLVNFLLGQALILTGDYKEGQSMLCSFDNCTTDELGLSMEVYYSRIMEQLKHLGAHEYAVRMLEYAVRFADPRDPATHVLWSNLFHLLLGLQRFEEAYQATLAHPDRTRRKDCLRHFLNVLIDKRRLKLICDLQYPSMEVEVEELLWVRARKSDLRLEDEVLYSLLNRFYITRRNYQKAACAVYERACRIAHELEGPEALYQQSRQLSVAATNLSNAAEKDQWVLVYQGSGRGRGSSKHPHFVKDLKELRKEGCVARNLMRVKDRQTIKLTPVTDPVVQGHTACQALLKQGDFDRAYNVVTVAELPLVPFFEGLVVQLGKGKTFHPLRHYLDDCDKRYHLAVFQAVFRQMTACNLNPPAWFIAEYFERYHPVNLAMEYTSCHLLEESYNVLMRVLTNPKYKSKHFTGVESALEHLLFRLKRNVEVTGDLEQDQMVRNLEETYMKFHH